MLELWLQKSLLPFVLTTLPLHFFLWSSTHFLVFFFFEILNETKLIHHYVNGNSCRIEPTLNVLSLESILVMTMYYFYVSIVFSNVICEIVVVGDQGINWMPNISDCSPLLNSFQQLISFFICFLVLGTIMGFKEWNLNKALYYDSFKFITSFLSIFFLGSHNLWLQ